MGKMIGIVAAKHWKFKLSMVFITVQAGGQAKGHNVGGLQLHDVCTMGLYLCRGFDKNCQTHKLMWLSYMYRVWPELRL